MRLFGSDRIAGVMSRLGLEEGQQLEHRWLNRSIETAQRRVEQQNYSIRKRTLDYDDVMNRQREIVYRLRGDIVRSEQVREHIYTIFEDAVVRQIEGILVDDAERTIQEFVTWAQSTFPITLRPEEVKGFARNRGDLAGELLNRARQAYDLKVSLENPLQVSSMERHIMLQIIDSHWQDYLRSMDALRQGVGLRAYGQRDPLVEYKREAFGMFAELMKGISLEISGAVFRAATSMDSFTAFLHALPGKTVHEQVSVLGHTPAEEPSEELSGPRVPNPEDFVVTQHRDEPKVGRNDTCPCGSGKKYKKCCGRTAGVA